jgi:hypothetical protein
MQERNGRTDGRTDGRTNKRTDGQEERQTEDRQTDKALKKFSVSRNFQNKFSGTNFLSQNLGTKLNNSRSRIRKREREN